MKVPALFAVSLSLLSFVEPAVMAGARGKAASAQEIVRTFDGTYVGQMGLVADTTGKCPAGRPLTIAIKDGTVPINWRQTPGTANISSAGRISGSVAGATMTGEIVGTSLNAEIGDGGCRYRWTLTRG